MDIINHQDNGVKGLRIAASVCTVIGWIVLGLSVIATFVTTREIIFGVPLLFGGASWCIMYLTACVMRATATKTEAAQLYIDKNIEDEGQYNE
jgi:hypothetical protein